MFTIYDKELPSLPNESTDVAPCKCHFTIYERCMQYIMYAYE